MQPLFTPITVAQTYVCESANDEANKQQKMITMSATITL